jgi:hypothetical protein
MCHGCFVVVRRGGVREAGKHLARGSRRGPSPTAGPHVGVGDAGCDDWVSLTTRSGCARSLGACRGAEKSTALAWVAGHSQHERGDRGGESARRHDRQDDQRNRRRCDRDERHDEQDASCGHERQLGSVLGVELVLGGRMIGQGSMLRLMVGFFHCSCSVIDSGAESVGVCGKPAPERPSRGAGRGASTTDGSKLALKLDAAQRQADEHSGALLGLDRQP